METSIEVKELSDCDIQQLFNENNQEKEHVKSITEARKNNKNKMPTNFLEFLQNVVQDDFVNGNTLLYLNRIVIQQGSRKKFFRGENKLYNSTKTSLARYYENNATIDKNILSFINRMRIKTFVNFLKRTKPVKWYQNFLLTQGLRSLNEKNTSPYYEAIAQHYGFKTNLLDITSDFEVAMFFANAECIDGKYQPLSSNYCKEHEFGYIYIGDKMDLNFYNEINLPNLFLEPVGYQPFIRCEAQNSYMLNLQEDDLQKCKYFKKYKFRHTPENSERLFLYMDGGKKIFPNEGLNLFSVEIKEMQELKEFPMAIFNETYIENEEKIPKIDLLDKLTDLGIVVYDGEDRHRITRQSIHRLDLQYEEELRKNERYVFFRKVMYSNT